MLGFLLVTLLLVGAVAGVSISASIKDVKENWPKYRCRPDVMLMSNLYGHDIGENLQFCLGGSFKGKADEKTGSFYTVFAVIIATLGSFLQSINSLRLTFSTIIGSANTLVKDFFTRFSALTGRIQMTMVRMRMLFSRLTAIFFSILYMSYSGVMAANNFASTSLFRDLDKFCFDPDTRVKMKNKGFIPIRQVEIGDVFEKTGDRVTAVFSFLADGQEMVELPGSILVSTNHYLLHKNKWIMARDHPDALPSEPWKGGVERPLICLNTETHSFPIGNYNFKDYDETEEGDKATMEYVEQTLNGGKTISSSPKEPYTVACEGSTYIKTKRGFVPASSICLGDELSFGKVYGVVKKECKRVCSVNGEVFASGTLLWDEQSKSWKRISEIVQVEELPTPTPFYSFFVDPSAMLETKAGNVFRDYMEVHSEEAEDAYTAALKKE